MHNVPDEIRVTDPDTGGQKGVKLRRYDLMPWNAIGQIAEIYGFGAKKYTEHNWRKGYNWGYSFGACQRHLEAFWNGEDFDPESGLSHLAHAGWHILTLLTFAEEHPGKDDRFTSLAGHNPGGQTVSNCNGLTLPPRKKHG